MKQIGQLVYQQAVSELRSSALVQRTQAPAYKLYGLTPDEIAIVEGKND